MVIQKELVLALLLIQGVNASTEQPFYKWPLAPDYADVETIQMTSRGATGCFQSGPGHPVLNYSALQLTGSSNSYLDFPISDSTLFDDFSIVLFFFPQNTTAGTIFHHKALNPNMSLNKFDLLLYYNVTHITFDVLKSSNNSERLGRITSQNVLNLLTWNSIILTYESQTILLYFEPSNTERTLEFSVGGQSIAQPGKLRIGKSFFEDFRNLQARVTCLQFYDYKIDKDNSDEALLECLPSTWTSVMSASSTAPCVGKYGLYRNVDSNKIPSSNPLHRYSTSSRVQCADWCSRPDNSCISFAVKSTQASCLLYSSDERFSLLSDNGTNYYVSSLVSCC